MADLPDPFMIIAFPNGELDNWSPVDGFDNQGNSVGIAFFTNIDRAYDEIDLLKLEHPESEFRVYQLVLAEGEEALTQRVLH